MATRNLSSGSIRGHLLRMAGFMLASMAVQTIYSLIDIFWVGRLGADAVAAVSIGSNLMLVVMAVGQVLAVGTAALVSQAMGRRETGAVRALFNQALLLSLVMGLLIGLGLFAGIPAYARALGSDGATTVLISQFLFWFVPSLALQVPMLVLGSALRGTGNVAIASIAQLATVLLNIVLAPLLIFGWVTGRPLGVAGAALATLIAILLGLAAMLVHMVRSGRNFDMTPSAWRLQLASWRRIAAIGLPSGLEIAMMAIYVAAVMSLLRVFGPATQAAFGIGMRLVQAGMIPAMAISFAAAAIVGQNFGAQQHDRVRETFHWSLRLSLGASAIFVLLFHLAPDALLKLFSEDAEVVNAGADFLRLISWNLVATGLVFAAFGVFSGLGDTKPSLISSVVRISLILGPAGWLSQRTGFSPHWIWWLSVAATVVQAAVSLWFLRRRFRRLPVDGRLIAA